MSDEIGYYKVTQHLDDGPDRVLSQREGEDKREHDEAKNVIDDCRTQNSCPLFGTELSQVF